MIYPFFVPKRFIRYAPLFSLLVIFLTGCQHSPRIFRIDIHQGNSFKQQALDQIKVGQTKEEVLSIMGSPMTQNAFKSNRWDYFYHFKNGKTQEIEKKHAVFFFQAKKLQHYEIKPDEIKPEEIKPEEILNKGKIKQK
jgi:outer membrane protein assembly factor BamE